MVSHILICSGACQPMILSIKLASGTLFMLVKFYKFSKPVTLLKCTRYTCWSIFDKNGF